MKFNLFQKNHKTVKGQTNDFLQYATIGLVEKDIRNRFNNEFLELEEKCARYVRAKYLTNEAFRKLSVKSMTLKPDMELVERKKV